MTKRWGRIGCISLLAVAALVAFVAVSSLRVPRFSDKIEFLKGIPSTHRERIYSVGMGSAPKLELIAQRDTFNLNETFEKVDQRAKEEFGNQAFNTVSNKVVTSFFLGDRGDPKKAISIVIVRMSPIETQVRVEQVREITWLDRLRGWIKMGN